MPQCTHVRSAVSVSGALSVGTGAISDAADEAARIERLPGIELVLERSHQLERARRNGTPRIDAGAQRERRALDHHAALVGCHEGAELGDRLAQARGLA